MASTPFLLAVMGPTASGKTDLAEALAMRHEAQLISADAFQVYRGFSIGTAKPLDPSRYHLIDVVDPTDDFGVGEWIGRVIPVLESLFQAGRPAILVGGTGYYLRALLDGYDQLYPAPPPELRAALVERELTDGLDRLSEELAERDPDLAARTDLKNPVRVRRALERILSGAQPIRFSIPPFRVVKIARWVDPEELDARITVRTQAMFRAGWLEEVQELLAAGVSPDAAGFRAIGYKTVSDLLGGRLGDTVAFAAIDQETRQYAKRQRTWLRGEQKLHWLGATSSNDNVGAVVSHTEALLFRSDP